MSRPASDRSDQDLELLAAQLGHREIPALATICCRVVTCPLNASLPCDTEARGPFAYKGLANGHWIQAVVAKSSR